MPTRSRSEVHSALVAKGMAPYDGHHHMLKKQIEGVTTLVTRVSHGKGEIGNSLAKPMANQLCLQVKEFWNLVDCPLSEEGWDELVAQRCADGKNPFLGR